MHTPAPWMMEYVGCDERFDNPISIYEITNGHKRIAEGVTEADAKLITAAPELLEQLKRMVEVTRLMNVPSLQMVMAAQAAIAKAEGK